ncbi:MAG: hypothetical protein LCH98_10195 [Actinobacteria bacterium]|nr:hypothetical protein [Actinomycetota bacterium]
MADDMHSRVVHTVGLVAVTVLTGGLLAGCGGGASGATPTGSSGGAGQGQASGQGQGQGQRGQGRIPGTAGVIAAVQGSTLQVQGNNQQTAVTYSGSTVLQRLAASTAAALTPGSCVTVRAVESAGSGTTGSGTTAGTTGGAATSGGSTSDPITAASVEVSQPVNGSCQAAGFGAARPGQGGGTAAPSGTRTRPTDLPSPTGTGGAGGNRGSGFGRGGVTGTVVSVSGTGFVVQPETRVARPSGTGTAPATNPAASATAQASPAPGTGSVRATETVTTTAATTYTALVPALAADLVVGRCVTAVGPADQTGTVAATSIVVREAENGSCGSGFGAPQRGATPGAPTSNAG